MGKAMLFKSCSKMLRMRVTLTLPFDNRHAIQCMSDKNNGQGETAEMAETVKMAETVEMAEMAETAEAAEMDCCRFGHLSIIAGYKGCFSV